MVASANPIALDGNGGKQDGDALPEILTDTVLTAFTTPWISMIFEPWLQVGHSKVLLAIVIRQSGRPLARNVCPPFFRPLVSTSLR
jgi:hypothetical protein